MSIPSDLSLWRCESCLTENSGRSDVCKSCHLPSSETAISKSTAVSAPDKPVLLTSMMPKGWECPTCLVNNKMEASKCVCCQTPNPSAKVDIDASKESLGVDIASKFKVRSFNPVSSSKSATEGGVAPVSGFIFGSSVEPPTSSSFKFGSSSMQSSSISDKKWNCPTCLVTNDDNLHNCPCCNTTKPKADDPSVSVPNFNFCKSTNDNTSPAASSFRFGNLPNRCTTSTSSNSDIALVPKDSVVSKFVETTKGKWACPTCAVLNDDAIDACPSCQTKNPGNTVLSKSDCTWNCPTCLVSNSDSVDFCPCCQTKKPLSASFNSLGDKWECGTCLVRNDDSMSKCVCCQSAKPNKKPVVDSPSSPISTSSSFQFADSPPVILSTPKQSNDFGVRNPSTGFNSIFKFGGVETTSSSDGVVITSSFSFSKPADVSNTSVGEFRLGYKPATFAPPVKPSAPSVLKNGGFQFGASGATSIFDFSARKENLTPTANKSTSDSQSVSFKFGSPPIASTVFKFGESKVTSSDASHVGSMPIFNSIRDSSQSAFTTTRWVKIPVSIFHICSCMFQAY